MKAQRLILEPAFSLEQRTVSGRHLTLPPQPDYRLATCLAEAGEAAPTVGATWLVNPNLSLDLPLPPKAVELLLIRLTPQLLIETATRLQLLPTAAHFQFKQTGQPLIDARLQTAIANINDEWQAAAAGWREMIASHIQQLTVLLLRQHLNVHKSGEIELSRVGIVDRRLRRAIEFMHDHCARELSLREIAEAAYLSEFHFARLFKKITGQTPHVYLAALRIERARHLLATTDLSISDIGAQVGYASQSHFTKVFRTATGMTPKAFQNLLRQHV